MSRRVPFKMAYTSSEDEGYSADELLKPGPDCKGWRSAQYCIYPQELVLQLHSRTSLDRLQFLVHSSMIPSRMEIELGDVVDRDEGAAGANLKKALFYPLGQVEWSSNKKYQYGGRQMQTVELGAGCKGLFVKLLLRKNHINRHNEYNQISLMGVNVIGVPDETAAADSNGGGVVGGGGVSTDMGVFTHRDDLGFLMYTDPDIAEVIKQLEDRRHKALSTDRVEYANKLKAAAKGLEEAGESLALEVALKRKAVDRQDYETAKVKKEEIERQREDIYRQFNVSDLLELKGQLDANDAEDEAGGGGGGRRQPSPRDGLPPLQTRSKKPPPHHSGGRRSSRSRSRSRTPSPAPAGRSPLRSPRKRY